eukprot:scaffold3625_cov25-Prasinocladus_malaysianus.AAC.1
MYNHRAPSSKCAYKRGKSACIGFSVMALARNSQPCRGQKTPCKGGSNYALYLDCVDVESPEGLPPRQVALPPAPAALATALHIQNRPEACADG